MTKSNSARVVFLAVAAVASMAVAQGRASAPFRVRAYHQHLLPDVQPMSVFHERLDTLNKHGYNMA